MKRSGRASINRFGARAGDEQDEPRSRPLLDIIPYAVLMLGLAVISIAIITLAWAGGGASLAKAEVKAENVAGTAPRGWIDR